MGFLDTSARIRRAVVTELDLLPAENYRKTLAAGVAEFAVGDAFCSDQTGEMRRYERIAAEPGYADLGDKAAPASRALVDAVRSEAEQSASDLDQKVGMVAATASNARKSINVFQALPGDGSNVATAAQVNAALALSRDQGVPAYIPGGSTVLLKNGAQLVMLDGSSIEGDGVSSLITSDYSSGSIPNCMIRDDWTMPTKTVSLKDFRLYRGGGKAQHAMLFNGIDGLTVEGVAIDGVPSVGSGLICISGIMNASNNVPRLLSRNILITDCTLADCANFGVQLGFVAGAVVANNLFPRAFREVIGIEPELGDTADNVVIIGNEIECLINDAIANNLGTQTGAIVSTMTSGAAAIRSSLIAHNVVRFLDTRPGATFPGVGLYGDMEIEVIGNTVRGAAGPGFQLGNLYDTGTISGKLKHARLIDNRALDCNQGGNTGSSGAGFYCRGATYNMLRGNKAFGAAHTSSYAEDSGANYNDLVHNDWLDTVRMAGLSSNTQVVDTPRETAVAEYVFGHKSAGSASLVARGGATANPSLRFMRGDYDSFQLRSNGTDGNIELNVRNDTGASLATLITLLRGPAGARAAALMFGNAPTGFFGATPAGKQSLPAALASSATLADVITFLNLLRTRMIATTLVS